MNTALLLAAVAVAWFGVGFVVALILGRLLRDADATREETTNRLIC